MSADAARPWWASPDPATDTLDEEQDPVTASRQARHATSADDVTERGPAHRPTTCGICPVCLGIEALGLRHPEVAAHLTEASRHLLAAFQDLVDSRPAPSPDDAPAEAAREGFQRIDVDGPDAAPGRGTSSEGSTP